MPAGRPTLYEPEFCAQVVAYMAKGFSLTAFAGHIRVARETIYEWARVHPEFSDAVKVAMGCRVEVLEEGLLDTSMPSPQITARIFALKNASPQDWRDRHEHTGPDGGPIQVTVAKFTADGAEVPAAVENRIAGQLQGIAGHRSGDD